MHKRFFFFGKSPCFRYHSDDGLYIVCKLMIVKKTITRNCKHYHLAWVFLPFVHVVKILICLVCIVANFKLSGL